MGLGGEIGPFWEQSTAPVIAPLLKLCVGGCLAMSLMLFFERLYMGVVILFLKLFATNPHNTYKWEPIRDDLELAHFVYPMVLVQIPMYNESEVNTNLIYRVLYVGSRLDCLFF